MKGLPVIVTILASRSNGDASEEVIRPTYEDPYTAEYKYLYDAIVHGAEVKTGPLDGERVSLNYADSTDGRQRSKTQSSSG